MSCMMSFFFVRLKNDESASRVRHVHTRDDTHNSLSKKKTSSSSSLGDKSAALYKKVVEREREREGAFFIFALVLLS